MKEINSLEEYKSRIKKVLITEEDIAAAVKKTGKWIDTLYDGHPVLIVGILKGSFVFVADLFRAVSVPCEVQFMRASSYYDSTVSSGEVKITMDISDNLENYHVIIAEDIIDTGRTLLKVVDHVHAKNPRSLHVIALVDKPSRRAVEFTPDMALFTIDDHFAVGYGLDCGEQYRGLPYIAEYSEE